MDKEEPRKILQLIQNSIETCAPGDKKKKKKLRRLLDKQKKIDTEIEDLIK